MSNIKMKLLAVPPIHDDPLVPGVGVPYFIVDIGSFARYVRDQEFAGFDLLQNPFGDGLFVFNFICPYGFDVELLTHRLDGFFQILQIRLILVDSHNDERTIRPIRGCARRSG